METIVSNYREEVMKNIGLLILLVLLLLPICACSKTLTVLEANEAYDELIANAENMNDDEYATSLIRIYEGIAGGNKEMQSEYAALVRKMINDDFEFADHEVFSVAADLAEGIRTLSANGAGISGIDSDKHNGQIYINIEQIGCEEYSVRYANDEMISKGERYEKYDGSLGKNLIKIRLKDSKISTKLKDKYRTFQSYKLNDIMKFMICPDNDHGIIIYVGSDETFDIDPCENNAVRPYNTISVKLKCN